MEEKMVKIKHNLKIAQDRHKSYADKDRTFKEFQVGEDVFLKVRAKKSSLKLGSYKKLAARYCIGPFNILSRIGLVAYELALPPNIKAHNVFLYLLNKYVHDPNHIIDLN